jgi:hypothetical protein
VPMVLPVHQAKSSVKIPIGYFSALFEVAPGLWPQGGPVSSRGG